MPITVSKVKNPGVSGEFSFTLGGDIKKFSLEILWEVTLDYDDDHLEPDQCPKGPRALILPRAGGGMPAILDASQVMYAAARPLLVRIALASRCPEMIRLINETYVPKILPEVSIQVAGRSFSHQPTWFIGTGSIYPHKKLTASEMSQVVTRETHLYEYFGVGSDLRLGADDLYGAVALLTTELEMAAYSHVGSLIQKARGDADKPDFDPVLYLGDDFKKWVKKASFRELQPDRYKACVELWGARHEVVHNGQGKIRPFNPTTGRVDKKSTNKRDLTNAEFDHFREGVQEAIGWMRTI
jgi:hypothetical protein